MIEARVHAQPHTGASQQQHALVLEQAAALELGLEQAGQLDDGAHVAVADRGALLEHYREQPAGGYQLGLEVGDHLVAEDDVGRVLDHGRAHDWVPPVEMDAAEGAEDCGEDAAPCGVPICGSIAWAS